MTARVIPAEVLTELEELARPLLELAASHAEVEIGELATPEDVRAAQTMMGFTMAVQALLRATEFNDVGSITGLATATGVILCQTDTDRVLLWRSFQAQMQAVINEVMAARAPDLAETEGEA